jgi:hypothetical protein
MTAGEADFHAEICLLGSRFAGTYTPKRRRWNLRRAALLRRPQAPETDAFAQACGNVRRFLLTLSVTTLDAVERFVQSRKIDQASSDGLSMVGRADPRRTRGITRTGD